MLKILIVEDDIVQYGFIQSSLERVIRKWELEITRIKTESDFYNELTVIADAKPDIIIMDVMLRWADPSLNIPKPPQEVIDNGFYRAGIRCIKKLFENEKTNDIPVIVYTALDHAALEYELPEIPHVKYVDKDFNPETLRKFILSLTNLDKYVRNPEPEERW
jgi:CheY-like chemotaxis protein